MRERELKPGGENGELGGSVYKKKGEGKKRFSMSATGSQGGGGGAAAASKRPMSSQKSGRSGSTPGPMSGQKKSTLGNGVSLPRKPSRSVYVFFCLCCDVYLRKSFILF